MNKPKLILHIGHAKTGTTSLQDFFLKKSAQLLKLGYLYPTRRSPSANHIVLAAGFVRAAGFRTPHYLTYHDNFKLFERDFHRFWKALASDIQTYSPHTVILSSEWMFKDFSVISRLPMAEFLGQFFSSVKVVAYIRSPVPDYLSSLAQRIKTGYLIPNPSARKIRSIIEYYQQQFPNAVDLHPFDPQQLLGGDIRQDFLSRYVPEALSAMDLPRGSQANVSLPWPLLRGLQQLLLLAQKHAEPASIRTRARMSDATRDYFRQYPQGQNYPVRLQPEIEDFIRRSAVDHLWLKDQFGISFADLNYEQIETLVCPFELEDSLEEILDFSEYPRGAFPIDRYLGNGPAGWISYMLFNMRIKFYRLNRIYVQDSWLWRLKRAVGQRRLRR